MPVKIIEESREKTVNFLEDVDVEFVSLVRHGANQMPFRIIKEEKGGGMPNMMIVQRILVAKHLNMKELPGLEGAGWLADAHLENAVDKGPYFVSEQADLDLFDTSTLKMVKVHDDGVWALVGGVKEGTDTKAMISLDTEHEKVAKEMPVSPMDAAVPMPSSMQTVVSFRELFFRELDSMLDVVIGSLNKSAGDTKKRKEVVLSALDSFRSFLAIGLDALGEESAKIEKIEAKKIVKEDENMFKTKEEFAQAVKELVQPMLDELAKVVKEEILKSATPAPEPVTTPDPAPAPAAPAPVVDNSAKELASTVEKLATKVDDLVKKWEGSLVTEPAAITQPDPAPVVKGDKGKVSPFSGMLTGRK